jgi:hypothetical protein
MEMSMHVTEPRDQTSEVRLLTDGELDDVNGGFFFIAVALGTLFGVGMIGGAIAANYTYTGNFWELSRPMLK